MTAGGPGGSITQRSVQIFHVRDGKAHEFWGFNEDQPALDSVIGG